MGVNPHERVLTCLRADTHRQAKEDENRGEKGENDIR
jgi:hypothetical protein